MFSKKSLTSGGKKSGHKLDMIHSIYRSPQELQKLRYMGVRDLICTTILPITPTSAQTYHDFFNWIAEKEVERCKNLNLRLHPVLGIPPSPALQDRKIVDSALVHLEEFIRTKKVFGIGEIGIGSGTKMEFMAFKSQLALARKFNLPVIVQSPESDKVAQVSLILKELKKSKVERAIFDHADQDVLKLVLRDPSSNIKLGLSVGRGSDVFSPRQALKIYKAFSHPQRLILNSGLGLNEMSVYGLHETILLFEQQNIRDDIIQGLIYENYLDIFPEISRDLQITK